MHDGKAVVAGGLLRGEYQQPRVPAQSIVAAYLVAQAEHQGALVLVSRNQPGLRSEEHTSELQSLRRISYAVYCLKKNHLCILTPVHLVEKEEKYRKSKCTT